jgi:DNA double-strand break repair helicase HerA and related ATPase
MAPCEEAVLEGLVAGSPLTAEYGQSIDRDSAYERLNAKLAAGAAAADAGAEANPKREKTPQPQSRSTRSPAPAASPLEKALDTFAKSAASTLGREIMRGIFGTARRRRRR